MPAKSTITGQHVSSKLQQRAEEMRHSMTRAEATLWQHLRAGRLEGYHFRRQQVMGTFIVDFYCHRAGLIVEVDGGSHLQQEEYDRQRERYLKSKGLRILRFTNWQVEHELDQVLTLILEACSVPPTPAPP